MNNIKLPPSKNLPLVYNGRVNFRPMARGICLTDIAGEINGLQLEELLEGDYYMQFVISDQPIIESGTSSAEIWHQLMSETTHE